MSYKPKGYTEKISQQKAHAYSIRASLKDGIMTLFVHDAISGNQFKNDFFQQQFDYDGLSIEHVCQTIINEIENSMNNRRADIIVEEWNGYAYVKIGDGKRIPSLCLLPFTEPEPIAYENEEEEKAIGINLLLETQGNDNSHEPQSQSQYIQQPMDNSQQYADQHSYPQELQSYDQQYDQQSQEYQQYNDQQRHPPQSQVYDQQYGQPFDQQSHMQPSLPVEEQAFEIAVQTSQALAPIDPNPYQSVKVSVIEHEHSVNVSVIEHKQPNEDGYAWKEEEKKRSSNVLQNAAMQGWGQEYNGNQVQVQPKRRQKNKERMYKPRERYASGGVNIDMYEQKSGQSNSIAGKMFREYRKGSDSDY